MTVADSEYLPARESLPNRLVNLGDQSRQQVCYAMRGRLLLGLVWCAGNAVQPLRLRRPLCGFTRRLVTTITSTMSKESSVW